MEKVKLDPASQNKIRSLKYLCLIGAILGIFVEFPSEFKWKSWGFFNMFVCLCSMIYFAFMMLRLVVSHMFEATLRHIIAVTSWFLFFKIAIAWPTVCKSWKSIDDIMNMKYGYPKIINKINAIIIALWIFSLIGDCAIVYTETWKTLSEQAGSNVTWEMFARSQFLYNLPYNHFLVALHLVLVMKYILGYLYMDIFIMIICVAVAMRFKQITATLKTYKMGNTGTLSWRKIRADYCQLGDLVFLLDDQLSGLIILSYSLNVHHLLIHLTNYLMNIEGNFNRIKPLYNTAFVLTRMISVTLFAAWINDESKKPAKFLNSLQPEDYNNSDVRRWLLQMSFDEISLTGFKLFKLNRKLILNIIGAIVTYELIIIQYKLAG